MKRRKTLLEIARNRTKWGKATPPNAQQMELAISWACGEVSFSDASYAFYGKVRNGSGAYIKLATILRQAVRAGLLVKRG